MATFAPNQEPGMSEVREGMRVVDRAGAEVGTVEELKMGDPEAVTTDGQRGGGDPEGLVGLLGRSVGGPEPKVPEPFQARLLRTGYIKINSPGLFAKDTYAAADEIAEVSGDVVTLTIERDQLLTAGRP